jgi:hypothetical protein
MIRSRIARLAHSASIVLCAGACLCSALAQGGLKVIDNPGGGQVMYGPVANQTTPQGTMLSVLRYIHGHFGNRPQVGNIFEGRDSQTFGSFFLVTAKSGNQAGRPLAGLVLISLPRGAQPAAAILYDDSSRFAKTEPVLLRKLAEAWKKDAAPPVSAAGNATSPGNIPPLTPTRFPDGSGAVNLPAGWRVSFASHGSAKIDGPRGEAVLLSNTVGPIYDPRSPYVQSRMRYANPNNHLIFCPSGDALNTYLCALRHVAPQVSFQLKNSRPIPVQGRAVQAVLIDADIDRHDGKGSQSCELGLSITATNQIGERTLGLNGTCAPVALAAQERPTLKAVYDSYTMNGQVVSAEFAGDQARSRAAGNNARIAANSAHATEDARSAAFQAHMDNIDRFSKSFQNYQLDQTELQDNNLNARGAVPNALADALVKANPDRFQTVPTQDFLKGVDF